MKRSPPPPPPKKASSKPSSERRAHLRQELLAQVQLSRESEVHIMPTANVSRGGLFVRGNPGETPELKVGVDVEVVIFDPEGLSQDVSGKARIVRVEAGKLAGRTPGIGLRFTVLDAANGQRLAKLIALR